MSDVVHEKSPNKDTIKQKINNPQIVIHPNVGMERAIDENIRIRLEKKIQNFTNDGNSRDIDIYSPKSVNIHPSGTKFYINSLEGAKTVVYSLPGFDKLAVIEHSFDTRHNSLWTTPSGLFKFRHYTEHLNNFIGKPVESTFSHNGRYLWVPYYRRSFDINAQDPSAVAVIDTSADTIIRIMEAGVLPKMIATSPDGSLIAIAHWGDNTVGLIDISSDNPADWKYKSNIPVGKQLFHNFSLKTHVNRDSNSGDALRGTVFTPDGKYLLVGCMGGGGGIAVIDVPREEFIGKLTGVMPNVRHLVIKGDWLYASINAAGYVQRISLTRILDAIENCENKQVFKIMDWESVKTAPGTRTIVLSPQGDYIFAACNSGSLISVIDSSMQKLADISVDSYPVGLDISSDGKWLITTSQGRNRLGGNCVDVFKLSGLQSQNICVKNSEFESVYPEESALLNVDTDLSSAIGVQETFLSMLVGMSFFIVFLVLTHQFKTK